MTIYYYCCKYERHFFSDICTLFSGARGLFSRPRLRGTQGGLLYTTAQVRVPGGLQGECSGRSKSRNLASNRWIALRPARANQAHANSQNVIFFSFFHVFLWLFLKYHSSCQRLGSHGTTAALQAFVPFVTATNGASAYTFVSTRVCHSRILQQ